MNTVKDLIEASRHMLNFVSAGSEIIIHAKG